MPGQVEGTNRLALFDTIRISHQEIYRSDTCYVLESVYTPDSELLRRLEEEGKTFCDSIETTFWMRKKDMMLVKYHARHIHPQKIIHTLVSVHPSAHLRP